MRNSVFTSRDVTSYYQSSQWLYRLFCYKDKTLGMHYGFWEPGTMDRQQAIANENDAIISHGCITRQSRVLDAGCGIGGTVLHIAKQTGARVTGITLDPKQVILATLYAQEAGDGHLAEFFVMDYKKMSFPSGCFDVVYAIESICYAKNKPVFLTEAYRILTPGGSLVIADGYAARFPKTPEEQIVRRDLEWGFCLPPVINGEAMTKEVQAAGFINVQKILKTHQTWPSVKYFGRLASVVKPFAKVLSLIPMAHIQAIYRNAVALRAVMRSYELGIGMYAVHVGNKPGRQRGTGR